MLLGSVDLNLFVMFDVIYTERNLTRAAGMLNITQPAVSNALNRLRMVFDDELFIRKPHGMEPTPVADNIISQVREALTLLNFSLNEGATFDPVRSEKVFRFSMNDLSQFLLLPPLLEKLQLRAPGVGASCFYVGREELAKELASGQIDIAIDAPLINDPDLCHQPLSGEEYVCVVRPDHPYSGADITIDEYLSFRHIHVSSRRSGDGFVDAMLNKKGLNRTVAVRVQHYMVAPRIIRHTNLAWTVPRNLAKHLNLRIIELPFELPTMDWHLYWHKSADNDQANRWMRELLLNDG